jgi:hypothetical protein
MLREPVKLRDCLKVESIYGCLLVEIAQKCTEFEQERRPTAFTLWKYIEKFEQNLGAWQIYNENQGTSSLKGGLLPHPSLDPQQGHGKGGQLSSRTPRKEQPGLDMDPLFFAEDPHEAQYRQILNFLDSF